MKFILDFKSKVGSYRGRCPTTSTSDPHKHKNDACTPTHKRNLFLEFIYSLPCIKHVDSYNPE